METINREQLEEKIKKALDYMHEFEWSGWGVDVLVTSEGELWVSDANSNNSVYPSSDRLCRVRAWNVHDLEDDYADEDEKGCIDHYSYEYTQQLIEECERSISENELEFEIVD